MAALVRILGVDFFDGTMSEAIQQAMNGGLVLAPSGPGLADLDKNPPYYNALSTADINLLDSGYLVMLWKRKTGRKLNRISGYVFLKTLLGSKEMPSANEQFWVMPSEEERTHNLEYLRQSGIQLRPENTYVAPYYKDGDPLEDETLLSRLLCIRPKLIVLNIAGGKQEILGAWLKTSLDYRPTILCTGAAIAFMTGQQAPIPNWADQAYLGWFFRILKNPRRYIPRYVKAIRLRQLIHTYGSGKPGPLVAAELNK